MNRLADIYGAGSGSLHIEINAGYGDYIELRTGDDLLELLRDLIAAGNAHFGTTARLIEVSGELNVGKFLCDDDFPAVALSPDDNPDTYTWADFRREHLAQFEAMVDAIKVEPKATHTWADHQAANQQALDDIADFVGGTRE